MPLERHYFLSDDLDDLERVETELIKAGVATPQLHVLSRDNAGVHRHRKLSGVSSFMKRDLIHSGLAGAAVGSVLAGILLLAAFALDWTEGVAGATPVLLGALAVFSACVWVGGLWGIQQPNHHFKRFQSDLDAGRHVFFVDLEPWERRALDGLCDAHPSLRAAGTGEAVPAWALSLWKGTSRWWYWRLWRNA